MNHQNTVTALLLNAMQTYERRWRDFYDQPLGIAPRARRSMENMAQLADNPYVDAVDMQQLYREGMYGPRFGGHGGHHGGGHHGGGRRWRRGRRRGRGGWGRARRWWPAPVYYPSFREQQMVMLRNLAAKIQRLWARLPNKTKWSRMARPYQRNPGRFFARFPLPVI